MIERTTDPAVVNRILNDPAIRPWVAEPDGHVIDISAAVANPANVCLIGDYGALLFFKYCDGIYEVHGQSYPEGRGEWMKTFSEECTLTMFCGTDAVEILTQVPHGHIASKALVEMMGGRVQFERPHCRFRGKDVSATIYALSIQDWAARAGGLVDVGEHLSQWLNGCGGRLAIVNSGHARVAGAMMRMFRYGNARKAVVWYNRWALAVREATIALINDNEIIIGGGVLSVADGALPTFRPGH